jgi:hypothetical protein
MTKKTDFLCIITTSLLTLFVENITDNTPVNYMAKSRILGDKVGATSNNHSVYKVFHLHF